MASWILKIVYSSVLCQVVLMADAALPQSIKVPMAPSQSMTIRIVSNVLVNCGHDEPQCSIFALDAYTGAPKLITNVTVRNFPYQEMVLDSVNQIVYLYIVSTQPDVWADSRLKMYSIKLPLLSAANITQVSVPIVQISSSVIMTIDYQARFLYLIGDYRLFKYDIIDYVPVLKSQSYSTVFANIEQWGPRMADVNGGILYYASVSNVQKYAIDLAYNVATFKTLQNDNNPTRCVGFFKGLVYFSTEYYSGGNTSFAFSNFTLAATQVSNYVRPVSSIISQPVEFLMLDKDVILFADRDLQKVQLIKISNILGISAVTLLASVPAQVPHGVVWYGDYVYVSTWGDAQASGILYFCVSSNTTDGMGQLRQFGNPSRHYGSWLRQFIWRQSSITQNITVGTTRSLLDLLEGLTVYRVGQQYPITVYTQQIEIYRGNVVAYSLVNGSVVSPQVLTNQSDSSTNPQVTIYNGNSGLDQVSIGVLSADTQAILKFVAFNERGNEQSATLTIYGLRATTTSSTAVLTTSSSTTSRTSTSTVTTSQLVGSTIIYQSTGTNSAQISSTTSGVSTSTVGSSSNAFTLSSVTQVSTTSSVVSTAISSMASLQSQSTFTTTLDQLMSTASSAIGTASQQSGTILQSQSQSSSKQSEALSADTRSELWQSQTSSLTYGSTFQFNAPTAASQYSSAQIKNVATTSIAIENLQQQQAINFNLQLIIIVAASVVIILTVVAVGCAYRKRRFNLRKRIMRENLYQSGSITTTNTTTFPMADVNSATVLNATIPYNGTVMGNQTAILSQY
ncbi:hypothetical protein MP228_013034 [Amoeboaphelidium protococcarum]|nr:hypothetical protein MP228_013034 [Amoeboaphelidium protococcarum]